MKDGTQVLHKYFWQSDKDNDANNCHLLFTQSFVSTSTDRDQANKRRVVEASRFNQHAWDVKQLQVDTTVWIQPSDLFDHTGSLELSRNSYHPDHIKYKLVKEEILYASDKWTV